MDYRISCRPSEFRNDNEKRNKRAKKEKLGKFVETRSPKNGRELTVDGFLANESRFASVK